MSFVGQGLQSMGIALYCPYGWQTKIPVAHPKLNCVIQLRLICRKVISKPAKKLSRSPKNDKLGQKLAD
jgi:hypothetical protein